MIHQTTKTVFITSDLEEHDSKWGALHHEYRTSSVLPCFFCDGGGTEKVDVGWGLFVNKECHHCLGSGEMDWNGNPIINNQPQG